MNWHGLCSDGRCECSAFQCIAPVLLYENRYLLREQKLIRKSAQWAVGAGHSGQSPQQNTLGHCTDCRDMNKNWYCNMFWVGRACMCVKDGQRSARVLAREPNGVKARSFFSLRTHSMTIMLHRNGCEWVFLFYFFFSSSSCPAKSKWQTHTR